MTWKTHLIGGAQAGILVCAVSGASQGDSVAIISAAMLGSVLPDLDQPKSKLSQSDILVHVISSAISRSTKHRGVTHTFFGAALFGALFYALAMIQGGTEESLISFFAAFLTFVLLHGTGSPLKPLAGLFAIAVYMLFGPTIADMIYKNQLPLVINDIFVPVLCALGVFAGAASHIAYDAFNKGGVPILFPFSTKNYRLMDIRTNTAGEFWFIAVQIVILGLMLAGWGASLII